MDLSSLKPQKGSTRKTKRRGRGEGSGLAVTAGRGHKGYGSRGGSKKEHGLKVDKCLCNADYPNLALQISIK